jgi:hypothetical protein
MLTPGISAAVKEGMDVSHLIDTRQTGMWMALTDKR